MYEQLLSIVAGRAEEIAKQIARDMQAKDEMLHYRKVSKAVREERILNVIRDMCDRLCRWISGNAPRSSLADHYSKLGVQRCRQGIPLDEVVLMLLCIKRGIWDELRDEIVIDNSFTLQHLRTMESNYHLFLDRMIQAVIRGYIEEMDRQTAEGKEGMTLVSRAEPCRKGKARKEEPA